MAKGPISTPLRSAPRSRGTPIIPTSVIFDYTLPPQAFVWCDFRIECGKLLKAFISYLLILSPSLLLKDSNVEQASSSFTSRLAKLADQKALERLCKRAVGPHD